MIAWGDLLQDIFEWTGYAYECQVAFLSPQESHSRIVSSSNDSMSSFFAAFISQNANVEDRSWSYFLFIQTLIKLLYGFLRFQFIYFIHSLRNRSLIYDPPCVTLWHFYQRLCKLHVCNIYLYLQIEYTWLYEVCNMFSFWFWCQRKCRYMITITINSCLFTVYSTVSRRIPISSYEGKGWSYYLLFFAKRLCR